MRFELDRVDSGNDNMKRKQPEWKLPKRHEKKKKWKMEQKYNTNYIMLGVYTA